MSGKTSLLKKLWTQYHKSGVHPIYATGANFNQPDEESIRKAINKLISEQYGQQNVDRFWQLEPKKRVLLIDNIHLCRLSSSSLATLLKVLAVAFDSVIASAREFFSVEELTENISDPATLEVFAYKQWQIRELAHRGRRELIEKWHKIGYEHVVNPDLEQKIRDSEKVIGVLIGSNTLPSYPFFVLTLLQINEAGAVKNDSLGSYGFHYEALLTISLDEALQKVRTKLAMDTLYTVVSRIAFQMFSISRSYLTSDEISEVLDKYRAAYDMHVTLRDIEDLLVAARILSYDTDQQATFNYRYIYCYFVARYFKDHLAEPEIREYIASMIPQLHIEDYANIIVFVLYFTKDDLIIKAILDHAKSIYSNYLPCNLSTDMNFLSKFAGGKPITFCIDTSDMKANNDEHREDRDRANELGLPSMEGDGSLTLTEENEEVLLLNRALKILHVMGQVLRNFTGSLTRETKNEIATECLLIWKAPLK